MNSRGKTAIITGGSKGIGAACADLFYREGYNVAILDVVPPEDNRVDGWFYKACDVASDIQVKKSIEDVYDAFGSIGVLINNAAIQRYGTVTETTGAEWDHVMNVNLKSAFLCSKYAIPYNVNTGKLNSRVQLDTIIIQGGSRIANFPIQRFELKGIMPFQVRTHGFKSILS